MIEIRSARAGWAIAGAAAVAIVVWAASEQRVGSAGEQAGGLAEIDQRELAQLQNELPVDIVAQLSDIKNPELRLELLRVQRLVRIVDGGDAREPYGQATWTEIEARVREALSRAATASSKATRPTMQTSMTAVQWLGLLTRAATKHGFDESGRDAMLTQARAAIAVSGRAGLDPTLHAVAFSMLWVAHSRSDPESWTGDDRSIWESVKKIPVLLALVEQQMKFLSASAATGGR